MSQLSQREVVLLNQANITTSGVGPDIVLPSGVFSAATLITVINTATGGANATLNVFLQRRLPGVGGSDTAGSFPTGTAVYDDLLAFTQATTNTTTFFSNMFSVPMAPTANAQTITTATYLASDAALAAGSARVCQLGGTWRVKWTLGGTSTYGNLSVVTQLVPANS